MAELQLPYRHAHAGRADLENENRGGLEPRASMLDSPLHGSLLIRERVLGRWTAIDFEHVVVEVFFTTEGYC